MRSFVKRENGFTILELMVSSFLLLIIAGIAGTSIVAIKRLYAADSTSKHANQNLRGVLDIIGSDLRVGGENLPSAFPAFEVIDGGQEPDELIVRRNLLDEILKVCEKIKANTAEPHVYFAIDLVTAGCIFGDNTHNYEAWKAYRIAHNGSAYAYILNFTTGLGEFFNYVDEDATGRKYRIWRDGGKWKNNYDASSSAVYLLEEWRYRVKDGVLEVVSGNEGNKVSKVMFDVSDFQIEIGLEDGTVKTSFTSTDAWTSIRYIDVSVTLTETVGRRALDRSLRSRFFPRNILSF